ncbi:hypothetical protein BST95_06760 [Halioglobus japonicus]|uniref:HdeD family acid-resistance protein n=1 Tax=Halioglobus japonicus TaxID=930805 RepID=A0AAP8MB35_9GAMM|nr:DUF308 domain-containing protein [Halioglobus japonicus]AQA17983.1 hypothetical protein BST95_06760 [Halioglobus japonicus]PLW84538.1 hypothetical protein C0029_18650 [Halioglobus japonicus]GHD24341.1 hypothetical protein GCM10007052_37870 [Halioglobus japonicus]
MHSAATGKSAFDAIGRQWAWTMGMGVTLMILGMLGLGMSVTATMSGIMLLGALLCMAGAAQFTELFQSEGWKIRVWNVVVAFLYVYIGVITMLNPALSSAGLILLIAAALIVIGGLRIAAAVQLRGARSWGWGVFGGGLTIMSGTVIATQWPVQGLNVIGTLIALEMMIAGWTGVIIALSARQATAPADALSTEAD